MIIGEGTNPDPEIREIRAEVHNAKMTLKIVEEEMGRLEEKLQRIERMLDKYRSESWTSTEWNE